MTPDPPMPSPAELRDLVLGELRARSNADNVAGMARYGISPVGTLGVTMGDVRRLARDAKAALGRDGERLHALASLMWESGVHEARIMATVLDVPQHVTRAQVEAWILDVDSWDVCDGLCGNLLWRTAFAWELARDWSQRPETFVRRAGLVMVAQLACKAKTTPDEQVSALLAHVECVAFDERNDVKKAASWAIRGVGKRSAECNGAAVACAERILDAALAVRPATAASKAARWVARDALRELTGAAVRERLGLVSPDQNETK